MIRERETLYDVGDALRKKWTDKRVRLVGGRPEHARFAGRTGRVVTVNSNGRFLIDFADGAWYDVPGDESLLEEAPADAAYDASVNSAQARPGRQA